MTKPKVSKETNDMAADNQASQESLESLLGKLEGVVQDLEQGDTELEQSLGLFEKGMSLVKNCNQRLEAVEQRILVVTRGEGEAPQLEKHHHQVSHEAGASSTRAR